MAKLLSNVPVLLSRLPPMTIAIAVVLTLLTADGFAEDGPARPNVVWLISEDNSVHYSKLYFETGAEMPNIRKLAEDGVLFNHAFSVAPVCSVARSTLATGCYPSRLGMQFHRRAKNVVLPANVKPVFELMHEAGYYTSYWKKSDYNFKAHMDKWDADGDWSGRRKGQPFFHKHQFAITHESQLQAANQGGTDAPEFVMPRHPNTPLFRQAQQAYVRLNETMDQQVGELVERLKAEGVLEDTFIFYFGDHGGVLPGSKGYLYEMGLHVPFVVRIPGNFRHLVDLKPGTRTDGFIEFVDVGPTTLRLAGIPIPEGMDGEPFMGPGVSRQDLESRDEALGIADRFDEKYDLVRTLRKGSLKYIRSYQPFNFHGLQNNYRYRMASYREWRDLHEAGKLNDLQDGFFEVRPAEELYDVAVDPYETVNLATDPARADQLNAMRARLTWRLKSLPDLSLYPESVLIDEALDDPESFGQAHRQEIAQLLDVADLSLLRFAAAQGRIQAALDSDNSWKRYWGLIVCSAFGSQADVFVEKARALAAEDGNLLVRTRAAEFLALIGAQAPQQVLMDVLAKSKSEAETLLVLNTVVLLRDGRPGYSFEIKPGDVATRGGSVDRRLMYLGVIPGSDKYGYLR
jgi:arylsulfatase A-like enzyme